MPSPEKILKDAEQVAKECDGGEFPDELEPQFLSWLLRELIKLVEKK